MALAKSGCGCRLDAWERRGLRSTARCAAWQVFRHAVARYRFDRVPKCCICRAASQDCRINSALELVRIRGCEREEHGQLIGDASSLRWRSKPPAMNKGERYDSQYDRVGSAHERNTRIVCGVSSSKYPRAVGPAVCLTSVRAR